MPVDFGEGPQDDGARLTHLPQTKPATSDHLERLAPAAPDCPEEDARTLFEKGDWKGAKEAWSRTLKSCEYVLLRCKEEDENHKPESRGQGLSTEKRSEFEAYKLKALLNLSLVSLKLRQFSDAVKYSKLVLEKDPENEKGLYRCAYGLMEQGLLTEAVQVIRKAKGNDPAVRALKAELRAIKMRQNRRDRAAMQRSFEDTERKSWIKSWWKPAVFITFTVLGASAVLLSRNRS